MTDIQDREEFEAVATMYKKLKAALGNEQDVKAAFASAIMAEKVQALVRDLPSITETIIQRIESEQ